MKPWYTNNTRSSGAPLGAHQNSLTQPQETNRQLVGIFFSIDRPIKVSVECPDSNGPGNPKVTKQLLIFVDPLDRSVETKMRASTSTSTGASTNTDMRRKQRAPQQRGGEQQEGQQRVKAVTRDASGLIYFGPGLHDIGQRMIVPSNTHVRIAGGAYVRGSLFTSTSSGAKNNISISGGGILAGDRMPHASRSSTCANDSLALINLCASSVTVTGITIVNSPTYMLQINAPWWCGRDDGGGGTLGQGALVRNVKVL
jgi:hypothetical protein